MALERTQREIAQQGRDGLTERPKRPMLDVASWPEAPESKAMKTGPMPA
jgi:hypothetical protein